MVTGGWSWDNRGGIGIAGVGGVGMCLVLPTVLLSTTKNTNPHLLLSHILPLVSTFARMRLVCGQFGRCGF